MKIDVMLNILLFIFLILVTVYSFGTGMYLFGTIFLFFLIWATSCIKITKTSQIYGSRNTGHSSKTGDKKHG